MHKKNIVSLAVASLLVSGCSGSSLMPATNDSFMVESKPSGATVYVMGEIVGTTPVEVTAKQVFPSLYPSEQTPLYGRIFFSLEGCEEYAMPVGTGHLSKGMKVKLECDPMRPVAQPVQAAEMPRESTIKRRLQELKSLFDEGLISDEDYESKRKAILEEL